MITWKTVMDEGYINEIHYKLYLVTDLDEHAKTIKQREHYELHYGDHVKKLGVHYPSLADLINGVIL